MFLKFSVGIKNFCPTTLKKKKTLKKWLLPSRYIWLSIQRVLQLSISTHTNFRVVACSFTLYSDNPAFPKQLYTQFAKARRGSCTALSNHWRFTLNWWIFPCISFKLGLALLMSFHEWQLTKGKSRVCLKFDLTLQTIQKTYSVTFCLKIFPFCRDNNQQKTKMAVKVHKLYI